MVRMTKIFLVVLILAISGNALSGTPQIKIGSKNSADHVVLGKALYLYLKIHSLPVIDRTNYGGSMDLRRAILVGDVDLYYESLSTAWFNYFHKKSLETSSEYLFHECKKLDRRNNLYWYHFTPANRTFALVVGKFKSSEARIKSISDWIMFIAKTGRKVPVAIPRELAQSKELIRGLVKHYKEELKINKEVGYKIALVSHSVIPRLVSDGTYFTGLSFATLGEIDYFELVCLKDDRSYFPAYNLCPVVRKEVAERFARLPFLLDSFSAKVTTDALRRFDFLVSKKREKPADVAEEWLIDRKLATPEEVLEYSIK